MKIGCQSCGARYAIMDSKVVGPERSFKVNCRKCGARIVFRGLPPTAEFEAIEWFYAAGRERRGPASIQMLRELYQAQQIGLETLVWRQGQDNWQPIETMNTLMASLTRGDDEPDPLLTVSRAPGPVVLPDVSELFAGLSPQTRPVSDRVHARNDSSVLFRLDELDGLEQPSLPAEAPVGATARPRSTFSRTETSGLLDIFAAAQADSVAAPKRPFHEQLVAAEMTVDDDWDFTPAVKVRRWSPRALVGVLSLSAFLVALSLFGWVETKRDATDNAVTPSASSPTGDAQEAPVHQINAEVPKSVTEFTPETTQDASTSRDTVTSQDSASSPVVAAVSDAVDTPKDRVTTPAPTPAPRLARRLSSTAFRKRMESRRDALLACDATLQTSLSSGAFMRANVTVLASGEVEAVAVVATGGLARSVVSCVSSVIRETRFEPTRKQRQRMRFTLSL